MNNFISIFKDTSLVTIVSLYELTGALGLALNSDANWRPFKIEGYLFIALIYFAFCFAMSRYSLWVEKQLSASKTARDRRSRNVMSDPIIVFDKVNKWYGDNFHVLRDIDLAVARGERIVICGPSGSGKSTLIRCINRLEEHQEGRLVVDGIELADDVKAIERGAHARSAWCSSSSTCSRT